MEFSINTFTGGMDTDTDKSSVTGNKYLMAKNFKLSTDKVSNQAALVSGISMVEQDLGTYLPSGTLVVGTIYCIDFFVVFCTKANFTLYPESASDYTSYIYKVGVDSDGRITYITKLYEDSAALGRLYFKPGYEIRGVYRKESESVQKIYWTDNVNNVRYCNIADPNLSSYKAVDFELIKLNKFKQPKVIATTGGSLKVGKYQYAYQLFKKRGAETFYSPASIPFNLIKADTSLSVNTKSYGGVQDDNSNKAIRVSIEFDNSGDFDYIRIISIYYKDRTSVPEIKIIDDFKIGQDQENITIVDNGYYNGEITLEEFGIVFKRLFACSDLSFKDNILFAANISEKDFKVDFDAKAFRANNDGNYITYGKTLYNNVLIDTYMKLTGYANDNAWADSMTWELRKVSDNSVIGTYNVKSIPEEYDYRNDYNSAASKKTQDSSMNPCKYKFKSGSYYLLGGKGYNIEYEFGIKSIRIDQNNESDIKDFKDFFNNSTTYTNFGGYNSPIIASNFVGYKRDEIYRFGIQFFDKYGRPSDVKWIADIRFPSMFDIDGTTKYDKDGNGINDTSDFLTFFRRTSGTNVGVYINVLYPKFRVRNLPSDVYGYRIVRAVRNSEDKTIVSQGFIGFPAQDSNDKYIPRIVPTCGANSYTTTTRAYFCSPEVTFGNFDITSSTIFKPQCYTTTPDNVTGQYATHKQTPLYSSYLPSNSGGGNTYILKYTKSNTYQLGTNKSYSYDIVGSAKVQSPETKESALETDFYESDKFINYTSDYNYLGYTSVQNGIGGSKLIFGMSSGMFQTPLASISSSYYFPLYIGDLCKDNADTIYGGCAYNSRLATEYIPCSEIVSDFSGETRFSRTSTFSSWLEVFGGDTYINYFEYLHTIHDPNLGTGGDRTTTIVYIPLESSINTAFSNSVTFSRDYNDPYVYAIRETAGVQNANGGNYYNQKTNFYSYNDVFSREQDVVKYRSLPSDYEYNKVYPNRIIASDNKINEGLLDSWTVFRYNNTYDVDSTHGKISNIISVSNGLMFWQKNAVGIVAVNERSIVNDNNSAAIVLGSGGVLARHFYISKIHGNTNRLGIAQSLSGIYWVDNTSKTILQTDGSSVNEISKISNIQSHMKYKYPYIVDVKAVYDAVDNEILFSIKPGFIITITSLQSSQRFAVFNNPFGIVFDGIRTNDFVMVEDENNNKVICKVYSSNTYEVYLDIRGNSIIVNQNFFVPGNRYKITFLKNRVGLSSYSSIYNNYKHVDFETLVYNEKFKTFQGTYTFNPYMLFSSNSSIYCTTTTNKIYYKKDGVATPYYIDNYDESYLSFIVNPKYSFTKVFDTLSFYTDALTEDKPQTDVSITRDDSVTFDRLRVSNDYQTTGEVDLNPIRREREFRVYIPRVEGTELYRSRIRDKYMKVELWYNNSSGNIYKFIVPYIITSYRISYR